MAITTTTTGIFQSDVLVRTALIEGFRELRKTPWLLDFAFAWHKNDALSLRQYGDKEIAQAKKWFLGLEIPVVMAERLDDPSLPCVAIKLLESSEAEATLGDIDPDVEEDIDPTEVTAEPRVVLGPFTPKAYDRTTGTVQLPDSLNTEDVFAGQYLHSPRSNRSIAIDAVTSDTQFRLAADSQMDMTDVSIVPRENYFSVQIESLQFRETYRLLLAASGEPSHLTYLFTIVMFVLLRYKQSYFEARGFERSTIKAQDVHAGGDVQAPEITYGRIIDVSGYVRNFWPKHAGPKCEGMITNLNSRYQNSGIQIIANQASPAAILENVRDQGWGMDLDDFGDLDSLG